MRIGQISRYAYTSGSWLFFPFVLKFPFVDSGSTTSHKTTAMHSLTNKPDQHADTIMNTKQTLQRVVCLNNQGASFLVMGDFPKARFCLSEALTITKNTATRVVEDHINLYICEVPNDDKSRFTLDQCMVMSKAYTNGDTRLQSHFSNYGDGDGISSVVFSQPIFIPEDPHADSRCELSAIIVFNLALTYHAMSAACLSHGCTVSPSPCLRKATALYDLSCQLIAPEPQGGDALFALTVSNNLIHAYQVLGEYGMAERYSQLLLSFLLARSFSGWDNGISNEMAEFFFGTVQHFVLQRNAPASAA